MDGLIVNFSEFERYDIQSDAEVVMFIASTPRGSFTCETPIYEGDKLRVKRQAFKEYVYGALACHIAPHEVEIG